MTLLRISHAFRPGAVLSFLATALFLSLIATSPARADLRVCNQTTNPVSIALGYHSERGWQSEGWWIANPGDCAIVVLGNLQKRYYYLYAVDDIGGGTWEGSAFMCTQNESFTIIGVEDCLARGYERTGFFEADTGEKGTAGTDNPSWTFQLTESNATSDTPIETELTDPGTE
ncbi:MAG: DUF1036 domain-containing protein [Hyphomicrobiaceae bacterium]|nr:DUF1036 domain-containing protein [Hyphomicrobiaceae bacterium]MCC0024117.1 DUF1036 domain-containing protein [Hyphomicrobiaceae bacterium]